MTIGFKDEDRNIGSQKSSEGGSGNPEKASPAAVERYIKGVDFPANKQDLIEQARKNNAPSDVLNVMNRFSDREYNTPVDIAKEVGRSE